MLRFNSLQCENNATSPYISVRLGIGTGPIGIFFSQVHGEVRNPNEAGVFEFLRAEGGDYQLDGMALVGFANGAGFTFGGYGNATFSNSRSLNGVRHIKPGVNAGFLISNCITGNLSCTGLAGGFKVTNCIVGDVTLDYPGASVQRFSNCDVGDIKVLNSGGKSLGVSIQHCTLASLTTDGASSNGVFSSNIILGDLNGNGRGHHFIHNVVLGRRNFNSRENEVIPLGVGTPLGHGRISSPVAPDPNILSLLSLPKASDSGNCSVEVLLTHLERLQVLLNAEISRRKDLEARLRAANVLT
jgi:hypothetical protein